MNADFGSRKSILKTPVLVIVVLLAVGIPLLLDSYALYMISLFLVTMVVVAGLNVVFGFAGQASLGSAAFMGIGAYTTAVLGARLGVPFPAAVVAGGLVAMLMGIVIGFPALRVSGFYLILVTMAFLGAAQVVFIQWTGVTGGAQGMATPTPALGPVSLEDPASMYYFLLVVAVAIFLVIRNLMDSKTGRAFIAIRENEIAAQSLGVSLARYKVFAFAFSSLVAGLGGGLYTGIVRFIDPSSFGIPAAISHVLYMVVGGPGSIWGPVVGSALVLNAVLLQGFDKYREAAYAGVLIVFLVFAPWGIVGLAKTARNAFSAYLARQARRMRIAINGSK
ncbi:MAG: branched-chain amino acid ABC transporter permease [Chloroflexota bacterium]|nr:MAG: branched-chain amino acid ABC transporter permease [Chloroflexota bacterium]